MLKIAKLLRIKVSEAVIFLLALMLSSLVELLSISSIYPLMQSLLSDGGNKGYDVVVLGVELTLIEVVVITLVIFLARYFITLFAIWYQTHFSQFVAARLSEDIYKSYLNRELIDLDSNITSDYVRSATGSVTQFVSSYFIPAVTIIFETLTLLIIMLIVVNMIDSVVIASFFVLIALIALLLKVVSNVTQKLGMQKRKYETYKIEYVLSALGLKKEIKIYNLQSEFHDKFSHAAHKSANASSYQAILNALPRQTLEFIVVASAILYFMYVIQSGHNFIDLLPSFATALFALLRMLPSVGKIMHSYTSMKFSGPFVDDIKRELKETYLVSDTTNMQPKVQLVEARLDNVVVKLVDKEIGPLNLSMKRGDWVMMKGASGSGKSTLLDVIVNLRKPDLGRVVFYHHNGTSNEEVSVEDVSIGYIPQDVFLLSGALEDNILLYQDDDCGDYEACVDDLGLEVLNNPLRNEKRSDLISGGQKQRIGIARALVRNPSLIILDESFASIDKKTRNQIIQTIDCKYPNAIKIVTAHHGIDAVNFNNIIDLDSCA